MMRGRMYVSVDRYFGLSERISAGTNIMSL
jgi:hypothetical protein